MANTICLQLSGGWLPLEDVSGEALDKTHAFMTYAVS
jgi:hypothetical protein